MPNVEATSDSVVAALSVYSVRYYKWTAMFGCWSAFVSGVLVILLIEALVLMFVVARSVEKKLRASVAHTSSVSVEILEDKLDIKLKGGVWITVLPAGDVQKMYTKREKALREKLAKEERSESEKGSKDSRSKRDLLKDYVLISPVFRKAKLQGTILHLTAPGISEHIRLEGCSILAVSGATEHTRKWAKKYPIKVHHATRAVYGGSHDCLLYLETGWEKEKWCEVLRAAAKTQNPPRDWFYKLKKEYKEYLLRVESQFSFFSRVNSGKLPYVAEDRTKPLKGEPNSSSIKKTRLIWKKLTRRSMKSHRENKSSENRQDVQRADEMKPDDIATADEGSSRSSNSSIWGERVFAGSASTEELIPEASLVTDESIRMSSSLKSTEGISEHQNGDSTMEQALLCGNALFARLFFDLYHSEAVVSRIRSILQRQLSKVPTPAYIGKIDCTHLDLGNSPPLARSISLLPVNEEGSWGLEADVEYHGGAILTIGTRIDVRDSSSREKVVAQGLEQSLAGAAAADLLTKGLETYTEELNLNVSNANTADQRNSGGTSSSSKSADVKAAEEASRKGWMQSQLNNVKAMMSRVAEQFSQVPLALTIKVVQLKGTLQVRVKPPPSDRVWFSFTRMPELELVPEPCIGDHKINSGPLGALIVNQIKILLRDTMVFPQFEDLTYNWMISDKDDWLPRDAVPIPFVPEQGSSDQSNDKERREEKRSQLRKEGSVDIIRIETSGAGVGPSKSLPGIAFQNEHEISSSPPLSPIKRLVVSQSLPEIHGSMPDYELTKPLLAKEDMFLESSSKEPEADCVSSEKHQVINFGQLQVSSSSDSESGYVEQGNQDQIKRQNPSRLPPGSKRARVLGFGKKMGNKLEEKRRNVVEKIRDRTALGPEQ